MDNVNNPSPEASENNMYIFKNKDQYFFLTDDTKCTVGQFTKIYSDLSEDVKNQTISFDNGVNSVYKLNDSNDVIEFKSAMTPYNVDPKLKKTLINNLNTIWVKCQVSTNPTVRESILGISNSEKYKDFNITGQSYVQLISTTKLSTTNLSTKRYFEIFGKLPNLYHILDHKLELSPNTYTTISFGKKDQNEGTIYQDEQKFNATTLNSDKYLNVNNINGKNILSVLDNSNIISISGTCTRDPPYIIDVFLKKYGTQYRLWDNSFKTGYTLSYGEGIEIVKKGDIFYIYTVSNNSYLALSHKSQLYQTDYNHDTNYNDPTPVIEKVKNNDWPYQIYFEPFVKTNYKDQNRWGDNFIMYNLRINLCPEIGKIMSPQYSNIIKYELYRKLKTEGYAASYLKANYLVSESDLKVVGYTASELKVDGFTAGQLRTGGYAAGELRTAGYKWSDLNAAGYTLRDVLNIGYTFKELKDFGYSVAQFKQVGYTSVNLRNGGFHFWEIENEYSREELLEQRYL